IAKKFGPVVALRDVSLTVAEGEFACFLGPSGCGKTTLLRIVAGLERQNAGVVRLAGRDVSRLPPGERSYGIVFQSYALFPNLTVARNVAYGLEARRAARARVAARVDELLDLVHLRAHRDRYPAQLSGGEQQRVALARALAPSPTLLLLDEPLSALDARVRVALRHEIKTLQRRLGLTTIMVTHDQEEALTMADRIVVMDRGRIEQVGTPVEVYCEPASAFVADFIGTMNFMAGEATGDGRVRIGGITLACPAAPRRRGPVTVAIRPEDVRVPGAGAEAENTLQASVHRIEFLGSYVRAHLGAGHEPPLALRVDLPANLIRDLGLAEGRSVGVVLPRDHLRIYAAAGRDGEPR
ncbi:MAG TPA: putative 2-aminoethylphosphonate ABC transporter ATP-binding protein, partial [Geminicoccaceae bacterium]